MADLSTAKQLTFDWSTRELASPDQTGLDSSNGGRTEKADDTASSSFDAAEIRGNEAAKRQLLVAAASGIPVRLEGPTQYVSKFRRLAGQLGVTVQDDKRYRDFVVEIAEPTRRERECRLPGTSSEEMRKALAEMSGQTPREADDGYLAVLEATIRTHHLDRRLTELISSVAQGIARLENAEKLHPAHVAEAVNYVLVGGPEPEVPKPSSDAPPLVRPDRQLTFDGLPHWKWPKPKEDSHTITVDRVISDIDGPPHRFVIQVGDTVEVFSTPNSTELAKVLDVCCNRQMVQARFLDEKDPVWISVGRIYPAPPGSNKQMGALSGRHHVDLWDHDRPYSYLGVYPAAALGYALGASTGAALAAKGRDRIVINIQGDGDFNYSPGSVWTAAHHNLPILTIMHNNRAYHMELMYLQFMAGVRGRGTDRAEIGTTFRDPYINYAKLAEGYGVKSEGPISDPNELSAALARGVESVSNGEPYLIDVLTQPR